MPHNGLHTVTTVTITALDDPRLADYAGLRHAHAREQPRPIDAAFAEGGGFIAEGDLVLSQLIGSRFPIRSVLISKKRAESLAGELARLPADTPVYAVEQDLMNELVGFDIHRGVLAVAERGPALHPQAVAAAADVLVIMEDLANHDNVGGIFRSVAALGGARPAVLLSPRCADPLYRKAVRVSMGHALRVPFAVLANWPGDLEGLARGRFDLIGLSPAAGAVDIRDLGVPPAASRRPALVVGAEGPGLSKGAMEVIARAGRLARIEMTAGVDSLNVTVATAVALHRLVGPG